MDSNNYHACNLVDGFVQCWGVLPGRTLYTPTPINQDPFGDAKPIQVTTGSSFQIFLLDNGKVYGRGHQSSYYEVLGLSAASDAFTDDPIPIEVSASGGGTEELSNVVEVVAGELHTCAIHIDRSMTCWGDDRYGKLNVAKFDGTTDRKKVKTVGVVRTKCFRTLSSF